jgi:nitroimidazol reductase NimA-like FMN-containing flavoprotein (pyridoxamine 5'-phosphate oxidase superfamily)
MTTTHTPSDAPQPQADRPYMPQGYGVPTTVEGLLPWSHITEQLTRATSYWVATVDAAGRPHVRPVWGDYVDGVLYVEGSPRTRWARNMAANPEVSIHLESAQSVLIVEGTAREIRPDPDLAARLLASMSPKYAPLGYQPSADEWNEGGIYAVRARAVFAWTQFPQDATRFRLGEA